MELHLEGFSFKLGTEKTKWLVHLTHPQIGMYVIHIQNHPSVLIQSALHHEVFTPGALET